MPGKPKSRAERRKYPRTQVLWKGSLFRPGGAVECVVLNLSANGAKLRLDDPWECPSPITLRIPRFGEFRAEVAWRKDHLIGLKFLEDPKSVARLIEDALPQGRLLAS